MRFFTYNVNNFVIHSLHLTHVGISFKYINASLYLHSFINVTKITSSISFNRFNILKKLLFTYIIWKIIIYLT